MAFIPLTNIDPMTGRKTIYGYARLTARDMAMLRWIGEQFAVSLDDLSVLEHLVTGKSNDEPLLKYKGIYALTSKWVAWGLVERDKVVPKEPMWVWLTKEGVNAVELEVPARRPSRVRYEHINATNTVRLHVEKKLGNTARWIGERESNASRLLQNKDAHQVDGVIEYPEGDEVAIEVELTQKRIVDLRLILHELQQEYDTVWYFASDNCYKAVKKRIEEIPNHEDTFVVKRLSTLNQSA